MADGEFTLPLTQSETLELTFRLKEGDEQLSFTGRTLKSQIRAKEATSSTQLADLAPYLTIESSGLAGAPAGDRIRLVLPADVSAALNSRQFRRGAYWDLFAVLDSDPGDSWLVAEGPVEMDPATTDILQEA